jgi:N-acyl-D-amino-acid deacylase
MKCQCVALDCYPYDASSTMLHTDETKLQRRVRIATSEAHPELAGRDLGERAEAWGVSRAEASRRLQPASAIYQARSISAWTRTMFAASSHSKKR